MEWVQYSFMMAMVMETIVTAMKKWVSWNQVMMFTLCVLATAMATETKEFFNPFRHSFHHCFRHSVNEP